MANKSLGRGLSALFGEENLDPAVPPDECRADSSEKRIPQSAAQTH